MKILKKLRELIQEVANLVLSFFKPFGLHDEMLEIPEKLKKMGFKVGSMKFFVTLVSLVFAFLLKLTNIAIDVIVLDECTSGLDDKLEEDSADAERILEYIVRYCNQDKKRMVIIATHQNIDGFKKKLASEFTFKSLYFKKEGEKNIVSEV